MGQHNPLDRPEWYWIVLDGGERAQSFQSDQRYNSPLYIPQNGCIIVS